MYIYMHIYSLHKFLTCNFNGEMTGLVVEYEDPIRPFPQHLMYLSYVKAIFSFYHYHSIYYLCTNNLLKYYSHVSTKGFKLLN